MSSQTEKDTARNKSKQNGGDGGTIERMSQREAAAGLNLAGNDSTSGRKKPMPTFAEREAAAGLNLAGNDPTSGRGKPMPTFAEREAAAGLNLAGNNAISGRDDFYNKRKKFNSAWSSFDAEEMAAGASEQFKEDVDVVRDVAIWEADFNNITLDPFTLIKKLFDDLSGDLVNAIPTESDFNAVLQGVFSSLTRQSSTPSSVASSLVALFAPLYTIINSVNSRVTQLLQGGSGIKSTLQNLFSNEGAFPRNGDFIYTTEFGNIYNIFEVSSPRGNFNPPDNLIYSINFSLNINGDQRNFIAIATLPVPNIAEMVKSLLEFPLDLMSKGISNGLSSLTTSSFDGIISGLQSLFTELDAVIQQILGQIQSLLSSIAILEGQITFLQGQISALWAQSGLNTTAIAALTTEIAALQLQVTAIEAEVLDHETRISDLELVLDSFDDVDVIGADGNYVTLKVLESTAGGTAKREITWMDVTTGLGIRSSFLIAQNEPTPTPATGAVDYRKVDYIHPDGTTYTVYPIVKITGPQAGPTDTNDFPNYGKDTVSLCENGTPVEKEILTQTPTQTPTP